MQNNWLAGLNPEQQEAVSHSHGPLLILAGAGSGKTTVLVSRTGRLIAERLTTPERVCVLTFTNKAANELKHRVARKLGESAKKVWAGTFHGFGLQILKENWKAAELPQKFGVIDANDALAVLKELLREHKAYEKDSFDAEKLMQKISRRREFPHEGHLDETIEAAMSETLMPKYLKRLRQLGVVDFEDLLLRPLQMMKASPELREKMQKRFDFMMVDEFQDTNSIQMRLVDDLTEEHGNIAVVGDDDQSIYGWRGAQIRNILDFPKHHKNCCVIRLERNYRSCSSILSLANAIIGSNKDRYNKVLKPALNQAGEKPELIVFENEDVEVEQIIGELKRFNSQGYKWRDMAVLYRSNSQGGLMEGGFRHAQIPYKLTGGTALFDRKEVKDALAMLRCSIAPSEVAFRRIVNVPARGIGDKTIEAIEAVPGNASFAGKALSWAKANSEDKASQAILDFVEFLKNLKNQLVSSMLTAEEVLTSQLRELGYRQLVTQTYRDQQVAERRWMTVAILGRILDGMFTRLGRTMETFERFVDCMELRDPAEEPGEAKDEVQMMTLHACKGLEFPLVCLLGLEEELLPHARLGQDVDEERRLFYVGVTRAQKHLIITRVRTRKRYGRPQPVAPSRFLLELAPDLYTEFSGGRPLATGERESMLADLMKKLNAKVAERES